MDLSRTVRGRLILFGVLYFVQGVPWGFISLPLSLYLTAKGMGPDQIGKVLALAYLPWSFKLLIAPLSDALNLGRLGRRRPWILGAELGMGLTLLGLAALDPQGSMSLFLSLIFLHNLFAAAQDVGVDALAVDILDEKERGTANGVMWSMKYAGVAVGGGGFAMIASRVGWRGLFLIMAAMIFAAALLPALVREPSRPPADNVVVETARTLLTTARSFALRATFFGLILFVLAPAGSSLLGAMSSPFYRLRLGYSEEEIGKLSGLYAAALSAAGAFAGGILSDKLGRRRAVLLFTLVTAALHVAFSVLEPQWGSRNVVYGLALTTAFADGMLQATYLSLAMDLSNPAVGGTQFTAFMSLANVRNTWTAWVGGQAATRLAAPEMFMLAAASLIAPLVLLPLVNPAEAKEAFRKKAKEKEGEAPPP
ncbi:MFS transporter [Chondromyces apiculatus]|uniref:Siderophore transporter, RhtX/FptX family n=1 Tax=Chondromyces apiculatus DSM 436 TaxID=1192034 RepID=A0A017T1V7_9BACT|nr:MFS transporter [Chondromyces apiculatus]EYF03213.1 siderophore transporter, RhtX/FptX family [Chondromyces apiculatus DSM 436]